ncbi:MAG: hypothetical protein ACREP8_06245 [Candidatus Binatia bacterium]
MESLSVEEKEYALFQPDILLSAVFFDAFRRKRRPEPEYRLMLAVLQDAVSCFQKYMFVRDERGKRFFREAEDWILEENSDWVFSFEGVCEVLGFNPEYIRQGLVRWKEREMASRNDGRGHRFYRLVG